MANNLSQKQLQSVKKIAEELGFQNYNVEINKGSDKGENFLGVIKAVNIKDDTKTLGLILKSSLLGDVRKELPIENAFQREIILYEKVFPTLEKIQDEYSIEKKFDFVPKMYGFCKDVNEEFLILENLRDDGYELFDRKKEMGAEHVEMVLRTYGKFHGLSLTLKHLKPEALKDFQSYLEPVIENYEEREDMWIKKLKGMSLRAVGDDDRAIRGLDSFFSKIKKLEYDSLLKKNEYSVIIHGDSWCNNFMFKYKDSKACPSDMKILDWQFSSTGSPIIDLAFFFYTCSSEEVIRDYRNYLDVYYNSVVEVAKQFGIEPDQVFPRNAFDAEWKKYASIGLYKALFFVNISLTETSEAPDLQEDVKNGGNVMDLMTNIGNLEDYGRRITNIVHHLMDNDLI